jgi:hypothetical protein
MGATRRDGQRARLRPHRRGHVFVLRGVDGTRLDVGNGAVAWRVVQCRTLIDSRLS